jgi:uncharacterized damage-inducible protein DinB
MSSTFYDIAPFPDYPQEYGTLLATLQDGTREWREELGDPDPKLIAWQAVPNGHSIGGVLLHIAEVEAYWIEEVGLGRTISPEELKLHMSAEIEQYAGCWPTPPAQPISYYYDILDKVRVRTLESVKAFGPVDDVKATKWGTMTLRWILAHVIEHESYHAGQAVLLHEIGKRMAGSDVIDPT